jgi:uncharacterized protein (DUF362 family)
MLKNELIVVYGKDPAAMTAEALEAANLEALILGAAANGPCAASCPSTASGPLAAGAGKDALIALKPNLVVAKPASSGATTHPEIVEAVIAYLRDKGFRRLEIIEGSWVGDATSKAFVAAGYRQLSERLGVPLVDLQLDSWKRYPAGGGLSIAVCDKAAEADFIINLPVVKGHCQTTVTCALKNLKGCMPDDEKNRFHELGLHEPIARLNTVLKPGFILADAICGDLDFEEGGNPVPMNRVVAALDPVLMDAYACRLMGHEVSDVAYIGLAEEYGVGSADLSAARVTELGDREAAPAAGPSAARVSGRVKALASRIEERSACSACYAALVHGLARLEERGELASLDRALAKLPERRIAIGRGFRGVGYRGIGCGVCARGASGLEGGGGGNRNNGVECKGGGSVGGAGHGGSSAILGCPPDGAAVAEFLERLARG